MVSDESTVYNSLKKNENFLHARVNHSIGEYVRDGFHTNGIENVWSNFKRSIAIYHQVSHKHLDAYCVETAFRYNSRGIKDVERWNLALTQSEKRLPYKVLINPIKEEELPQLQGSYNIKPIIKTRNKTKSGILRFPKPPKIKKPLNGSITRLFAKGNSIQTNIDIIEQRLNNDGYNNKYKERLRIRLEILKEQQKNGAE